MEVSPLLGIRHGPTLRLVIIPQALRVIIPPLISQYLNLTKNSSLGILIGYSDLFNVFGGISLNRPASHRNYLHVDVGISLFQPTDFLVHELVQPAHCADGALSVER